MQAIAGWIGLVFEHMPTFVVLGVGIQLVWGYAIQTIADKEEVAHSWMAWVPLLQVYPLIAAGGSFSRFLGIMALGILAIMSSALLGPIGLLLALAWCVWLVSFFVQLCWNTAEKRGVAGWVGLLAFVPLMNVPAYLYIAFHDGPVPPHRVGMLLGFVFMVLPAIPQYQNARELAKLGPQLPAMAAAAESEDQEGMLRLMRGWFEAMEGMQGLDASDAGRDAMSRAMADLTAAIEGEGAGESTREGDDDAGQVSEDGLPPAAHRPPVFEKAELRAVSVRFQCAPGTRERGAHPPRAYRRWCERVDPVRGVVRHGGYASWHADGQLRRVGVYQDGKRQGVWTRWSNKGVKQAQAEYQDGLQHGFQLTWDETGHYYHQVRYVKGEPVAG